MSGILNPFPSFFFEVWKTSVYTLSIILIKLYLTSTLIFASIF